MRSVTIPTKTPKNASPRPLDSLAKLKPNPDWAKLPLFDGIVKQVRFPDWQNTSGGQREVQRALRLSLKRFQLHTDQDLFDKAYGYIRQYY